MKRIALVGAIGLGLGLGVATGTAVVVRHAPTPLVADSLAVDTLATTVDSVVVNDSTGVDASGSDSLSVDPAGSLAGDSIAAGSSDVALGGDAASSRTADADPAGQVPSLAAAQVPGATDASATAEQADSTRARLSRIYGAMEPDAAAEVLQQLGDVQIQSVLLGLSDRRAAAILALFPPDRAAALTGAMLAKAR